MQNGDFAIKPSNKSRSVDSLVERIDRYTKFKSDVNMETSGSKSSSSTMPIPAEQSSGDAATSGNSLLLADEQKMVDIEEFHHNDVLCGRGVTTNRHPGNESFRSLVGLNKELYVSSTKRQKMGISRSIVQAVRSLDPPGRFLDKDAATGLWHDIGHKKAVEKTSQALRDGAAVLRKQLSADLGDPNFLNAVFSDDMNTTKKNDASLKDMKEKKSIKTHGKENSKEAKVGSTEKVKVIKAKHALGKKGHRRIKSNPSVFAFSTSKSKMNRRYKTPEEPRTPGRDYRWNYHQCPPSPHSPGPALHARSLPNSPMPSWGGGPPPSPYYERNGSHSYRHSQYHHFPHPSPYSTHSDHEPYRSHSYEHHHGPPGPDPGLPPRHHAWSPHGATPRHSGYHYQHSYSHYHYHHHPQSPAPTGSASPPPPSLPPSNGPLPPGRQKKSSEDYYPTHPAPLSREEPWSPRGGYRAPYETYTSPQSYYSPRHGDYRPEKTPSWTPKSGSPEHHAHYYNPDHRETHDGEEGLSVPSLGGEGRSTKEKFSPTLHLAPRLRRQIVGEHGTPPRPPPSYCYQDFRPPTPTSQRYQRPKEDSAYYHRASVEEEKKTADVDKTVRSSIDVSRRIVKRTVCSWPESIKSESRSSPDQDEIERNCTEARVNKEDQIESRASPGDFLPIKKENDLQDTNDMMDEGQDDQSEEAQAVDEIAMSPIPYDREDPVTLLDLPDDILALPISPCGGPHDGDDPALS